MARRRTGRKRGRPYNPASKRNQTDRAGRRGAIDEGSDALRLRKLMLTGRADVEMDAAGILFGRDLIDRAQYDQLGRIALLLRRVAVACGHGFNVSGLWASIVAAGARMGSTAPPLTGDLGARGALERVCGRLNGSKVLVLAIAENRMPPIVLRAAAQRMTPVDMAEIAELRAGLDDLSRPRRSPRLQADEGGNGPRPTVR
jgi:hypothetical protein